MNEKQMRKWEKTRGKGLFRFLIWFSIIIGIALTISNLLFDYYWDGVWQTDKIAFYLIIGVIVGWIIYKSSENSYQKAKTKNNPISTSE